METLPTTLNIDDIFVIAELDSFLPELDAEELDSLINQIKTEGVRDPFVIWKHSLKGKEENVLVDGHNRRRILKDLKITEAPVDIKYIKLKDISAAKEWMLNNQLSRRNLDVFTRVLLALKLEADIKQRAAERKKKGQFGADATDSQISDEPEETGTVLEILGEKAQTSKDTVLKIKKILKGIPRLQELVGTGQLSINQAADIVNKYLSEEQNAAIDRLLLTGKHDKWEIVGEVEPQFEGATNKVYQIKKSIVQFAEKDGKPDLKNFMIGKSTFSGLKLKCCNGELMLIETHTLLPTFPENEPMFFDGALAVVEQLHEYLMTAKSLLNSGDIVREAGEKVNRKKKKAKKAAKDNPAVKLEPIKIDQPTKAVTKKRKKPEASKTSSKSEIAVPAPKAAKNSVVKLDPIEKAIQLLTNEEGDRFNYIGDNDEGTYESIINELKTEIDSYKANGKRLGKFVLRDILRARLKTPVEASTKAPKFSFTDEDKTAILEYYRNDHRAEHSIKSIEEYGFDPEKVSIEKVSIGEALRLKRANPDAVLPEIEWKKKKTAPKKAPASKKSAKTSKPPKVTTPTPPAVRALLDAQEQLTEAEKQSLIDSTGQMPEKKQIAAIEKAIEHRKEHSIPSSSVQEQPAEQMEQPTEQPEQ